MSLPTPQDREAALERQRAWAHQQTKTRRKEAEVAAEAARPINQGNMVISTCYGQTIQVGDQVAHVTPTRLVQYTACSAGAEGGNLRVARVVSIEKIRDGFAEADPVFHLTLDDGYVVDVTDVVKTDGEFQYAR